LDHPVDRGAVHHRVVAQDRHAEDVDVAILQRARLVVVHLLVAQQELLLRRDGREPRLGRLGGRREALDLLDRLRRERARGAFRQIERLEDELAHLPRARAAVVTRARQVELALGPGHADVEEAPLLLLVEVARRERLLDQLDGQLERVPPPADRKKHTSELQSRFDLVCRLLLEKKNARATHGSTKVSAPSGCSCSARPTSRPNSNRASATCLSSAPPPPPPAPAPARAPLPCRR